MSNEGWSQWLDFDRTSVEALPESPGVCVMHASMKILYIGAGQNIRRELSSLLENPCTSKAKRFRYILTPEFDAKKEQHLKEYLSKHGRLPPCMEQNNAL
jgi:hypothetical protein